ncbi:MAG: hypothetical protein PR2021_4470 [Candidatus Phytoplasma pruni]|nr:hypothetical protein [Poinsettia branch-inducing phytoplasma]WEK82513.1 MAG: hypothetical protein PR2021_4470 [Candidatus Phytoplasma pruni]
MPEIHENYVISHKISQHSYFIYDFSLPLIVLYTLYSDKIKRLKDWLMKSPMKQFTTLDAHDYIGVVDAFDLLTDDKMKYTTERIYKMGVK